LGKPIPKAVDDIRVVLARALRRHNVEMIDAQSVVTGKDFLLKIWRLILGVPIGVAIIDREMSPAVGGHQIALISSHRPASKSGQLTDLACAEKGSLPASLPQMTVCYVHALRLPIENLLGKRDCFASHDILPDYTWPCNR
jgi:hypothetical protein